MLIIKNENDNPFFNHAAEEYMLRNFDEECFMLWINRPSILLGRNQNALAEINLEYAKANDITIVRRPSGGGAVFNDYGNMNYTFISQLDENGFADFKKFAYPIIEGLRNLSINAEFSGRNDITIDGKKISGTAQYKHKNRVIHHGTMLYSASISSLSKALNVRPIKLESKGVTSVTSRVTNISQYLNSPMTLKEFKEYLTNFVIGIFKDIKFYEFTKTDLEGIEKIVREKYETWDWNFGKSPQFSLHNERKYEGGILETSLNVDRGIIKEIKFYGDFFGKIDVSELEGVLVGVNYEEDALYAALEDYDINNYMNNITKNNLIHCILGN
jgi:lipoate-protein ligase A